MAEYVYMLGPRPAVQVEPDVYGWGWPAGAMGMEIIPPGIAAQSGAVGGVCLIWAAAGLPGYDVLAAGDCREIVADATMRGAWESIVGLGSPVGDRLVDLLWWQMTEGAIPDGPCKPIVPTSRGIAELHLDGHSLVRSVRWTRAASAHRDRVLAVVQRDMQRVRNAARSGQLRGAKGADAEAHRRILGFEIAKYRDVPWQSLVPADWPARESPVTPETSIADTFDRADSATLGTSSDATWSWNELSGTGWEINTNRARHSADGSSSFARADTDLSGADHYCEMVFDNDSGAVSASGPCVRKDSTATLTFYHGRFNYTGTAAYQLFRVVAGTLTQIGSNSAGTITGGDTVRLTANGSTISVAKNGSDLISQTDTNITGNTRIGMRAFDDIVAWRSLAAADVAAGAYTSRLALLGAG